MPALTIKRGLDGLENYLLTRTSYCTLISDPRTFTDDTLLALSQVTVAGLFTSWPSERDTPVSGLQYGWIRAGTFT